MPREITKTVYTYDELIALHKDGKVTDKALERAKTWLGEGNTDHDWWDATLDGWVQALDKIGFIDADISFRGFWSQGDGASFKSGIDLEKLADFFSTEVSPDDEALGWIIREYHQPTNPAYKRLRTLGYYCYPCKVARTSSQYSHERTCRVELEFNSAGDYDRASRVAKLLKALAEDAEAYRLILCRAIYDALEKEYEYLHGEEAIAETAEANGYTFLITGEREG